MRVLVTLGAAAALFAGAACGGVAPQVASVPAEHSDTLSYSDALLRIGIRQRHDDSPR